MPILPGGLWYQDHCLKITPNKKVNQVRYRRLGDPQWIVVPNATSFAYGQSRPYPNDPFTLNVYVDNSYENGLTGRYLCKRNNKNKRRTFLSFPRNSGVRQYLIRVDPFGSEGLAILQIKLFTRQFPINGSPWTRFYARHCSYVLASDLGTSKIRFETIDINNPNNLSSYVLYIYQDEKLVKEVSSSIPLEAEIIDSKCIEDEPTKVEFETSPLGHILVSKTAFDRDGGLLDDLLPECINIYNVIPFIPIGGTPSFGSGGGSGASKIVSFVGQYCSDEGCEPPTVKDLGDKCGESCPDDTCAVLCGNHICCHAPNGKAIQQISLNDYAG